MIINNLIENYIKSYKADTGRIKDRIIIRYKNSSKNPRMKTLMKNPKS